MAEATGQDGSIVASNVYGERIAPSNTYQMKGALIQKEEGEIALGRLNVIVENGLSTAVCMNSLDIGTAAGSPPSVTASGEQVEWPSTGNCEYPIPEFTLGRKHHA